MKNKKWFFPIIEEIEKATEANKLQRVGFCIQQDIAKDYYQEIWNCKNADGDIVPYIFFYRKNTPVLHIIIYKYMTNYFIQSPVS